MPVAPCTFHAQDCGRCRKCPEFRPRSFPCASSEAARRVERAQILLAYREKPSFFAVGQRLGLHHQTVQRCVGRALAYGPLTALDDRPRPCRSRRLRPRQSVVGVSGLRQGQGSRLSARIVDRFCLAASMRRSTSRSVRYSRLRLPTVTFTEVGAASRSRDFSMQIALQPIRTVTDLRRRVTEPKSPDHRNASMVEGGILTPRYTLAGRATAPVPR
jgi:hypothetical protein